jgi:hypothetical protein
MSTTDHLVIAYKMAYKLAAYVVPDVEGCGFLKAGSLLGIS